MVIVGGLVATRFWKSSSSPSTRGMTSKTGIAVALPYQGTHQCVYLVRRERESLRRPQQEMT